MDMDEKPRLEDFEVVMLKKGTSSLAAKPEDFVRVPVSATDPLSALLSDAAVKKQEEGFQALFAAKPGSLTDPEIQARARASATPDFDRSKL